MNAHTTFDSLLRPVALLTAGLRGDAPATAPPAQRAEGGVKTEVRAVLVDVVVRDKHGLPVRDLQAADVEVFEDGVPQAIGSFTPIFERNPRAATTAAPAPARP